MDNLRFSVAEFNEVINRSLELVGEVTVEGEITQMNVTQKGGINIVIKDPKLPAILNVSGYAPRIQGMNMIKQGMQVACWGKPSLWSLGGRFSLQIYKILPLGAGALKEAYEQLKIQLEKEGLFSEERKRPLPDFIRKIALITGKDSAAQSDFLKILKENKAGIEVDFYPVQVQGKYSETEILRTLKYADKQDYDCICLVRGGGSLEDLITFNSETIARALFGMRVPVIVGVGHEKDESIADFVADKRASTPSQAAYYIIANNQTFIRELELQAEQMRQLLEQRLLNMHRKLELSVSRINQKLSNALYAYRNKLDQVYFKIAGRLRLELSTAKLVLGRAENISVRLQNFVDTAKQKVSSASRLLQSYNPENVLKRGYSLVKSKSGKVITKIEEVEIGEKLQIKLYNGQILTDVLEKTNNG